LIQINSARSDGWRLGTTVDHEQRAALQAFKASRVGKLASDMRTPGSRGLRHQV